MLLFVAMVAMVTPALLGNVAGPQAALHRTPLCRWCLGWCSDSRKLWQDARDPVELQWNWQNDLGW